MSALGLSITSRGLGCDIKEKWPSRYSHYLILHRVDINHWDYNQNDDQNYI
jgi:hypothetical protein